jgi:transposase InsO family protein
VDFAVERGFSQRRATALAGVHRSSARYRAVPRTADTALLTRLLQLKAAHPRFGVPRILALLRAEGRKVNHKRVQRLWSAAGLQVPRRRRRQFKKPPVEAQSPVPCAAERPNHVWSYDFIEDGLLDGRKLRILNVLDEFTREWLAVKVGASLSGKAVVSVLCPLFGERGCPAFVRSDNGGEFIAAEVKEALRAAGTTPAFIAPGSPWQNGFVESFHGKLRDECLDREVFLTVKETQVCLERQRRFYNEERPHSALGYVPPAAFRHGWDTGQRVRQVAETSQETSQT